MITPNQAKLIQLLPSGLVTYLSKRILGNYIKKYATIEIKGKEKLADIITPTIFVCNHLSNSDGLILSDALKSVDPTFVAGVKLSKNAITNLGVNVVKTTSIVPNSADHEGIRKIIDLVKSGESILLFPEGTRSRTGSLIEAKKGILLIAKMTGAPIVPLGLSGTDILLPINQSGNMSAESFQYADVTLTIGQQFEYPKKAKGQDKKEFKEYATKYIMNEIATLLPESYRGVYK